MFLEAKFYKFWNGDISCNIIVSNMGPRDFNSWCTTGDWKIKMVSFINFEMKD